MQYIQLQPTIDDILRYEETLIDGVEKEFDSNQNPKDKAILLKLQVLLKSRAVKTFVDHLKDRKFSLSSFKKIQEIDDALDELRVMNLQLPYPEYYFVLEQGKANRVHRNTLLALFCALFGYEWVE